MLTPQLYDPGEEDWRLRLHIGCGSIYLEGYVNVDIAGQHPYEAPELLERNRTGILDYYGRKDADESTMEFLAPSQGTVVDSLADMRSLHWSDADKIVCIQAFEHLTQTDANRALLSWWNALKVGGIVIISVPDPIATAELLRSEEAGVREFALRHLRGSGMNTYTLHHWAYTEPKLRQMLTGFGFTEIERLPNIHFYPAIVLKAKKTDPWVHGRAYQQLPEFPESWKILDVGPGKFPLASATHFFDISDENQALLDGKPLFLGDLDVLLPYKDDSFDFVYCSHVLEHLESPILGLEELQRVGKRGFVEIPSFLLDFMMKQGQTHPKWMCWGSDGDLIFIEKSKAQNRLFLDWDRVWGAFFHHSVHGTHLEPIHHAIRRFFWENQHLLNISALWDENSGIQAVEIRKVAGVPD